MTNSCEKQPKKPQLENINQKQRHTIYNKTDKQYELNTFYWSENIPKE